MTSGLLRQTPGLKDPEGMSDGVENRVEYSCCCRSPQWVDGARSRTLGGTRWRIGSKLMTAGKSLGRESVGEMIPSDPQPSMGLLWCSWTSPGRVVPTRMEDGAECRWARP